MATIEIDKLTNSNVSSLTYIPKSVHYDSFPMKLTFSPRPGLCMLLAYAAISPTCNLLYSILRTQNSKNPVAKTITFILGFPFTLITYFTVTEGSE